MALVAIRLLRVKATEKYTYGYKKTTILVALLNAAILLLSIGAIGYEALHRLMAPKPPARERSFRSSPPSVSASTH
jgi:cobalt-zinc-cadmium efflux system protein